MLVFEPRPLRSDNRKPKEEFRLGHRGLSSSIVSVCRYLSAGLRGGRCSAFIECPCLSRVASSSGKSLGALRFLLFCKVVANGMGTVS